jgi:hypothetical protein
MLVFDRLRGMLFRDKKPLAMAYAGQGMGLNDPAHENLKNVGPLPAGGYTLHKVNYPHLGPIVFRLEPDATNHMFGRGGFYIHWDNSNRDFSASEGCIVPIGGWVFSQFVDGEKLMVV